MLKLQVEILKKYFTINTPKLNKFIAIVFVNFCKRWHLIKGCASCNIFGR